MTDIARRIQVAEARLPPGPPTRADALRHRLTKCGEVALFVGIFGNYHDYLTAADFARLDDHAGALSVAARINEQFDGRSIGSSKAAIEIFESIAWEVLTEGQLIRLQELLKQPHPLCEPDIAEFRTIIFSAVVRDRNRRNDLHLALPR